MMKQKIRVLIPIIVFGMLSSCAVIHPGELGLKQRFGKIKPENLTPGLHYFNPLSTRIIKINVRTIEVKHELNLPTKEGLSISATISMLYHLGVDSVQSIYTRFGTDYQSTVLNSNFMAIVKEISSEYLAYELFTREQGKIEESMKDELNKHLQPFGINIDAVLLKEVVLPKQIIHAIEDKLIAEQEAQQMDFVIEKQKKESERLLIEAEGTKKSQQIIDQSLSNKLIQFEQVKALKSLMNSPNAKIIVTDGKIPFLLSGETSPKN